MQICVNGYNCSVPSHALSKFLFPVFSAAFSDSKLVYHRFCRMSMVCFVTGADKKSRCRHGSLVPPAASPGRRDSGYVEKIVECADYQKMTRSFPGMTCGKHVYDSRNCG